MGSNAALVAFGSSGGGSSAMFWQDFVFKYAIAATAGFAVGVLIFYFKKRARRPAQDASDGAGPH